MLLHILSLVWASTAAISLSMSPQPCSYRLVSSASSHNGISAEEKIRTCTTRANVVTLDDQIYIVYHEDNKVLRSLVVQFESSAGKPVPIAFHGNVLSVHVTKNQKLTAWRKSVAGVIVAVRRDHVEHFKYRFMDVYGHPVTHCCRGSSRR